MAHAHYMLDTEGYKYDTLSLRSTYCFSTANYGCTNAPQCYVILTSLSYSHLPQYEGVSVGLYEDARTAVVQEKLTETAPEVSLSCFEDIDI